MYEFLNDQSVAEVLMCPTLYKREKHFSGMYIPQSYSNENNKDLICTEQYTILIKERYKSKYRGVRINQI